MSSLYGKNGNIEEPITKRKKVIHNQKVFEIDSDLDNFSTFFDSLIRTVYCCIELFYVEHKGKFYYNCSNMWSTYDVNELPEYVKSSHEDFVCDADEHDDCPIHSCKINIQKGSEKYIFRYNSSELEDFENLDLIERNFVDYIKMIFSLLETMDMHQITFISPYDVTLVNNAGINYDHRGSDHTLIELPFYSKVRLGKTFTLHEFVVAAYKIKSHKFDYHYELFYNIDAIRYDVKSKEIFIETNFDHGR